MPADLRTAVRIDVDGGGRFRGEMRRMGRSLDALGGSTRGAARASHAYRQATARAEAATRASTGSILTAHAALARYAAAFGAYRLVRTITSFERLRAQMRAVTGDAALAASEFARLQQFATQTPFSLQELVRGYVQLSAVSVEASDDVLTSLGNLAAVFGDFEGLVSAIRSRERETFKRFGIDLRQNGAAITVAYKDFSTTVKNSAPGLVRALREISDRFFPRGMAERAATIEGAFNNLGDTVDELADALGRGGLSRALSDIARDMTAAGSTARGLAEGLGAVAGAVLTATAAVAPWLAALAAGRLAARAAAAAEARFGAQARAARAAEAAAAQQAAGARHREAAARIHAIQVRRQATAAAAAEARAAATADLVRARAAQRSLATERIELGTLAAREAVRRRELAVEASVAAATERHNRARRAHERAQRRATTAARRHNRVVAAGNALLVTRTRLQRGLNGLLTVLGGKIGLVTTLLAAGAYVWLRWGSAAARAARDARAAHDARVDALLAPRPGSRADLDDVIAEQTRIRDALRAEISGLERKANSTAPGRSGRAARIVAERDARTAGEELTRIEERLAGLAALRRRRAGEADGAGDGVGQQVGQHRQALDQILDIERSAADSRARIELDRIALVDRAERQAVARVREIEAAAVAAAEEDKKKIEDIERAAEKAVTAIRQDAAAQRAAAVTEQAEAEAEAREGRLARALAAEQEYLEIRRRLTETAAAARADVEQQLASGRDTLATPWERATAAIEQWEATARRAVERQRDAVAALAEGGPDRGLHAAAAAAEAEQAYAEITETAADRRARAWETEAQRRLRASKRWEDGVTRGLARLGAESTDFATLSERAVTGAFRSMEDALVQLASRGKASFGDLAQSIIADLARIAIRAQITGPLYGWLSGLLGAGAATTYASGAPLTGPHGVSSLHTGGIAGALAARRRTGVPARAFAGAPRLHGGGLPLAPDEVPAILRRGEGVFTPEQMRALGPPVPPQIHIEFENRGTAQRQIGEPQVRSDDGRRWIVSVVLDDVESNGSIAQGLQRRFALRRRV